MKKSLPSKRKLVIVETQKLALDFCFDAPEDGQTIKKMRMLDTHANTKTLKHIISTKDTLEKKTKSKSNRRVKQVNDQVGIVNNNVIKQVDVKEGQQMKATSKAKASRNNATQNDAADDNQRENDDNVEESITSNISRAESTATTEQAKVDLKASTAESVVTDFTKAPMPKLAPTHQCHLCVTPPTNFFNLIEHYASAHNITIPKCAKYPHLQPDIDNPDHYCQMCDKTYNKRSALIAHLRVLHDMKPPQREPTTIKKVAKNPPKPKEPQGELASSTIRNNASNFAIKFMVKDGSLNRLVVSPSPPTSNASKSALGTPTPDTPASGTPASSTHAPSTPTPPPATLPLPALAPAPPAPATSAYMPTTALTSILSNNPAPYPDILDPNNYCRCCDKSFVGKPQYRKHCRTQHKLPLPDPNDPNFFCNVCNLAHPDLFMYRKHMGSIHRMAGFPEMVDIPCYHCPRVFADAAKYKAHLKKMEKKEQELQLVENRPPPVWDEPNFYCSRCLKSFGNDINYKGHLRKVHKMSAKHYKKQLQQEDALQKQNQNQSNNETVDKEQSTTDNRDHFFCFACRIDFFDKEEFNQHLKRIHKLNLNQGTIDNLRIAASPPIFARPLDPTLYYFMMKDIGRAHS